MKILFSLMSYSQLTGSELYVFELAKEYKRIGHEVLITAPEIGGEITEKSRDLDIEVFTFDECPYNWDPDILHLNQYMPAAFALFLYPETPAVMTIHSEFNTEKPLISERIYKYICIRDNIKNLIIRENLIDKKKLEIVYNGFDFDRFNKNNKKKKEKNVLFVGTIDLLRKQAIEDLIKDSQKNNYKVTIVGKKHAEYLDSLPKNVEVYEATWNVDKYISEATETAGVLLGRTTIEGWVSGLSGYIYDIDANGEIISKTLHKPPKDIEKYNIKKVANKILVIYADAIFQGVQLDSEYQTKVFASLISNLMTDLKFTHNLAGKQYDHNMQIDALNKQIADLHLGIQNTNRRIDRFTKYLKPFKKLKIK